MSSARVTIWDKVVGYLYWDEQNRSTIFEPETSYIDDPINIAPYIHQDKQQRLYGSDYNEFFKGMIPVFNDSLPDYFGNVVFKEWLIQNEIDQSDLNPVERLLYVGKRGVGALEYEKGKSVPNITGTIDLDALAQVSDKIIKRKYEQSDYLDNPEALRNILSIGSSIGGAQAKILVAITKDGRLLAGDILHEQAVNYYIVKLEHDPSNVWYKEKNYVEYVYNQIARDAGITVSDSRLIEQGGRAHFASKRFDRVNNEKIHSQTVNAITGFYGRNTEFSYETIFKLMEFLSLDYQNFEQLFLQMVFNVAASNRDDHTKNFSFIMNRQGNWQLSPAYDLTMPYDPYQNFGIPHQISINNKTRQIDRADLVAVANLTGIRNYNPLIDGVIEAVMSFEKRIKQYNLNSNTIALIIKELEENISRLRK